jgi:hypothetical protein
MAAIVIRSKSTTNLKLLMELAKRLGESASALSDEQLEDLSLGFLMKKEKTGKNVSREAIMKKLRE